MTKSYHHGDLKKATLKKAVEVIQKKRDVDFTLREIAQSLGVTHAAVYRHFKSKKDLLSHIAEDGFHHLHDLFVAEIEEGAVPAKQFANLGRIHLQFALKYPGYYRCMFHSELRGLRGQRKEYLAAATATLDTLETCIQRGVAKKTFRRTDTRLATRSAWAGFHGFALMALDGHLDSQLGSSNLHSYAEAHLQLLQKGLAS